MSNRTKLWRTRISCLALLGIAAGCGNGDSAQGTQAPPTAELIVNVTYASAPTKTVTNSLHVWALRPKEGVSLTCNELIGGKVDPYDFKVLRLADQVATEVSDPITVESVEVGEAFVYVEGVNFGGEAEIAGCATITLSQPSTTVAVTLQTAGVFDCSAADTEDGAACDDGEFCTVGETCRNGTCQGGRARNCSALADGCNAAACSESEGCQTSPVSNGTPCDDGLFCTGNDSCQDGICIGSTLDCAALAGPCRVATGCDEGLGTCIFSDANQGNPCDDGLHCTVSSVCSFGSCIGTSRNCSAEVGDDCNIADCSEEEGGCYTYPASIWTSCNDSNECTESNGSCNGAGVCTATPVTNGLDCDGGNGTCQAGTCEPN
jgi:hypothetical protein